jgi:NitT/TauT family transport system permease protein
MNMLFSFREKLSEKASSILTVVGAFFLILLWSTISFFNVISSQLLPSPIEVLKSYHELHFNDALVRNLLYSVYLNSIGYLEALIVCLPIGFIIGLFPFFKGMFNKPIDAFRFLPLTAVTGLFIAWFGIGDSMKIQFLAFGIIVYLLPVVIQRVDEVPEVYQQTAFTLGASKWQMFKTVFFPHVIGQLINDIRVLVAISWTYIIIAELLNSTGGIGSLIYIATKQGRMDKVFAILAVVVIVGILQDKMFKWLDRVLFKYKYA